MIRGDTPCWTRRHHALPMIARRAGALRWAQRLKRVFGIEIEACAHCGAWLKLVAGSLRQAGCGEDRVVP